MKPHALTDDDVQRIVTNAVGDAVDFIDSEVAPDRIRAQKYFDGDVSIGHEPGRSKVVDTVARDTVRAIMPALMRVFLQTDKPVEFIPRSQDAVQGADQATKYASYVFARNNGFGVLYDVFHDALIKKVGISRVYYDETPDVEIDEYTGLTEDQLALVMDDEGTEVLESTMTQEAQVDDMGVMIAPAVYDLKVAHASQRGEIKVDSIAPEDFFVDRGATCIDDAYVCGFSTEGRVGDLVDMGFPFEEVYDLGGSTSTSGDEEEEVRSGYDDETDGDDGTIDVSMRKVLITEAYMKVDIEGTGVPRMYKFLCGGGDYKVLEKELCDYVPFSVFEVDPEPHTFFGRSLIEIIEGDQDASTALLRGLLDSVALSNNPRIAANDATVNMDDLMNGEIGAIIRTKGAPLGQMQEMTIGQGTSSSLPALQRYDEKIRSKTGVTGAGMGMDADALQGQTATGVNAAVQAATAVSELIARTLAEGGMKRMMWLIAQIARANPNPDEMIRIDGQFIPVDPRSWSAEMDMSANVGLGHNGHDMKMMTLNQVLAQQTQIYQGYGPTNGLVSLTNIRNTMADIMGLGGIHNVDRHIMPMNPQLEQQMQQQAAQAAQAAQQNQADPNAAYMQVETQKAQLNAANDAAKLEAQKQKTIMEMLLKIQQAGQQDDLARDKMLQDLAIQAGKILADTGVRIDQNVIKREQAATQPAAPVEVFNGLQG